MRILADENIPRASIALLRSAGHDVVAVAEAHRGKKDATVLQQASADSRVLLTFDGDFGRLIFCQDAAMPGGVIFLRFVPETPDQQRCVRGHWRAARVQMQQLPG